MFLHTQAFELKWTRAMFTTANDLIKLSTDNIVQLIKGHFLIPPRKWKKVQNILVALYYSSKTKSNFYGCSQSKENGRFVILSTHPKQRPSQSKENGRPLQQARHTLPFRWTQVKKKVHSKLQSHYFIFTGPRCLWGPVYGSRPL